MKTKILFATLLTLALFTAGHARKLDKAKLKQFLDRLAEKNKGIGSLGVDATGVHEMTPEPIVNRETAGEFRVSGGRSRRAGA